MKYKKIALVIVTILIVFILIRYMINRSKQGNLISNTQADLNRDSSLEEYGIENVDALTDRVKVAIQKYRIMTGRDGMTPEILQSILDNVSVELDQEEKAKFLEVIQQITQANNQT